VCGRKRGREVGNEGGDEGRWRELGVVEGMREGGRGKCKGERNPVSCAWFLFLP
jgi:hypothetical protein